MNLYSNLEHFSSFYTRYYKSSTGRESSEWLLSKVTDTVAASGALKYGASVRHFNHPWGQNSVIATLPGRTNKTVVIGAHQDSINLLLPSLFAAPGADDDGSGTVTILEALRVILEREEVVKGEMENTLEFQWYSAEEGGLLGSQAIFSSYKKEGRDVAAMLQQDMTGYVQNTLDAGEQESVGVITDYVDPDLTDFIKKVVTQVCSLLIPSCGHFFWPKDSPLTNSSTARFPTHPRSAATPALTMRRPLRPVILQPLLSSPILNIRIKKFIPLRISWNTSAST